MPFELHEALDEGAYQKLTRWGHRDLNLLNFEDVTLINLSYRLVCNQVRVFLHYGHQPSVLAVDYAKIFASEGLIILQGRLNSGEILPTDARLECYKKILKMLQDYRDRVAPKVIKAEPEYEGSSIKPKRHEAYFVR